MPVGNVHYTQASCSNRLSTGQTLEEMIRELDQGRYDPLKADFLRLEGVMLKLINGTFRLFSNDNRRLYCLKQHQKHMQRTVHVRVLVHFWSDAFGRFLNRFETQNAGEDIVVRGGPAASKNACGGRGKSACGGPALHNFTSQAMHGGA